MRKWIFEKSMFVFFITLALYIFTIGSVPYVGVYLTYVAIPVIVLSGLIAFISKNGEL